MFTFFGPGGVWFFPPLPPRPFTPAGVKGSLITQFCLFGPDRSVDEGGCGMGLLSPIGERGGHSHWIDDWRGCASSERAHASPSPLGRAEQRSGARIRAGACLSVASLRTTPGGASSARNPAGARPWARLFFGYFLLAKQKKVARPTGRNRYLNLRPTGRNLH